MLLGRWHDSHFCWKIGATSLVNVTVLPASAAAAGIDETRKALQASATETRNITGSFRQRDIRRTMGPKLSTLPDIIRWPRNGGLCLPLSLRSYWRRLIEEVSGLAGATAAAA